MQRKNRAIILLAALLLLGGVALAYRGQIKETYQKWQRGPIPEAVSRQEAAQLAEEEPTPATEEPASEPVVLPEPKPAPKPIATKFNLSVPFVPQAPHKIWDEIHEDTCEEAAAAMLQAYYADETDLSLDEMEARLQALVAYQNRTFGDYKSTNMATIAAFMTDFLGMKVEVLPVDSIDDVKAQIKAGRPVLLPAAGKLLMNPNFKNGGPLYHALIAKGYTKDTIITNDPGTRLGADYAYDNDVLFDAIHDWNGGDVLNGAKLMLVVTE